MSYNIMVSGELPDGSTPPLEHSLVQNLARGSTSIHTLKDRFYQAGGQDINFGFSLARSLSGFDMALGGRRFLGYQTSPQDLAIQLLLEQTGIPIFKQVARTTDALIAVLDVPIGTRPLDSIELRDTKPTGTRVIGSFEIMAEIGKYLADIRIAVLALPDFLTLKQIAFLNGELRFIRIVPPLHFSPNVDLATLMTDLKVDLSEQYPNLPLDELHQRYVRYLSEHFRRRLRERRSHDRDTNPA